VAAPGLQAPPGSEPVRVADVVFDYAFPPAARSFRAYAQMLVFIVPLVGFIVLGRLVFGTFWVVLGVTGVLAVVGADEWMRFERSRARLRIDADGGLWVNRWNGSQRHWLATMKEVEVARVAYTVQINNGGSPANIGRYYQLVLRIEGGSTTRIRLPGGARFPPGSGPLMPNADLERFAAAARRWCPVRRS